MVEVSKMIEKCSGCGALAGEHHNKWCAIAEPPNRGSGGTPGHEERRTVAMERQAEALAVLANVAADALGALNALCNVVIPLAEDLQRELDRDKEERS